ncbi:MAG: choice-of-anchor D domain-containing protein, partial [Polyangia bacterium]|nr:choice-of-anchor D domain-containing protein [Polyangia bacterium]
MAPNCVRDQVDAGLDGGPDAADAADAAQPQPDIGVAPLTLDFGAAPLHEPTTRSFTMTNSGDAALLISAITVEETGALKEVVASIEGAQDPALSLAPGGQLTVQVTLTPEDQEADSGQIRIASNDPDEPELLVAFVSNQEGLPILDVCALDDATDTPEPFVDCAVDPGSGDPLVDFGVVSFTESATRVLTARNLAEGNAPLVVNDVYVTSNAPPGVVYYTVDLYRIEPGSGGNPQEVAVSLPAVLRSADESASLEEDRLYVRLSFLGKADGSFPARSLVFETNDATTPHTEIPVVGILSGCPPDQWDIDGNPNNGCEYHCVYEGPEICDGRDNDCDGLFDEENAAGCVWYYRDSDNDSFGITGDRRCLCGPEGLYRAEQGGDCDDTRSLVNPGMLENCQTAFDDDCTGSTNDLGALNCTLFYRDHDQDGYGLSSDSQCRCAPAGEYTATAGGDCNDGDPNVRPGVQEDCGTAYDDNCNGSTNEDDALACVNYYVDLDNDGYGQTMLSRCLCAPAGNYKA